MLLSCDSLSLGAASLRIGCLVLCFDLPLCSHYLAPTDRAAALAERAAVDAAVPEQR